MYGIQLIARLAGAGRRERAAEDFDLASGGHRVRRYAARFFGVVVPHQLKRAVLEEYVLADDELRASSDLAPENRAMSLIISLCRCVVSQNRFVPSRFTLAVLRRRKNRQLYDGNLWRVSGFHTEVTRA